MIPSLINRSIIGSLLMVIVIVILSASGGFG